MALSQDWQGHLLQKKLTDRLERRDNTKVVSDNTMERRDNNVSNLKKEDTGTYDNTTESRDNNVSNHKNEDTGTYDNTTENSVITYLLSSAKYIYISLRYKHTH